MSFLLVTKYNVNALEVVESCTPWEKCVTNGFLSRKIVTSIYIKTADNLSAGAPTFFPLLCLPLVSHLRLSSSLQFSSVSKSLCRF